MTVTETTPYATEELKTCPVCGSADWSVWVSASDSFMRRSDELFSYARCKACDVLFEQKRPTEGTMGYFYEGDYAPYQRGKKKRSPFRFVQKIANRLATDISGENAAGREIKSRRDAQLSKPGAAVLDFGCGGGRFLDSAKTRFGTRTVGMDFNSSLFDKLRARGHQVSDTSPESWAQIPADSFDLVIMNHVLEHVYHPRDVLQNVRRVLKPDGVLDIAVPNPNGYSAGEFKEHWFSLDSPRHVILYSPETATKLLNECGYPRVDVVGEPVMRDAWRSVARQRNDEGGRGQEGDVGLTLGLANTLKREAEAGRFDRFHLFCRKG